MLEWLYEEENYTPKAKGEPFIDKTLKVLHHLIFSFQDNKDQKGLLFKWSIGFKVGASLALVLITYFIRHIEPLLVLALLEMSLLMTFSKNRRRGILQMSWVIPCFTLIMILPAALMGNMNSVLLPFKVFLSLLMMNMFANVTGWYEFLGFLKKMKLHEMFLLTLEITLKYLLILARRMEEMFFWLKKRGLGNGIKIKVLGHLIGNLFITAYEASEETYHAMQCRGFTGVYYEAEDERGNDVKI